MSASGDVSAIADDPHRRGRARCLVGDDERRTRWRRDGRDVQAFDPIRDERVLIRDAHVVGDSRRVVCGDDRGARRIGDADDLQSRRAIRHECVAALNIHVERYAGCVASADAHWSSRFADVDDLKSVRAEREIEKIRLDTNAVDETCRRVVRDVNRRVGIVHVHYAQSRRAIRDECVATLHRSSQSASGRINRAACERCAVSIDRHGGDRARGAAVRTADHNRIISGVGRGGGGDLKMRLIHCESVCVGDQRASVLEPLE